MSSLTQFRDQKVQELSALEHQVSVMSLSNPDATAKIKAVQTEIKQGLADFATASTVDNAKMIYQTVGAKILDLKVLLSGNQLPETIDELIDVNQQVTLDLNLDNQDTSVGVEIEAQLEALGNEIEDRSEQNGFLTDEDISEMQAKVISQISKIMVQEANRDSILISKQVKTESEEISEAFDQLATVVNDYYGLKADLVKVEAEVYEYGRILQQMPSERADKFKAKLWQAWSDMQKILKAFLAIALNQTSFNEICERIAVNNG